MPKPLEEIHAEALKRFDKIISAVREVREQCLEDRRFAAVSGAMWEGDAGAQFANKPKYEVNLAKQAVERIITEYRNNRIAVDFVSTDTVQDASFADDCDAILRGDMYESGGEEAVDNCVNEGVSGGMGALRLFTDYEDHYNEDNDRQKIKIVPVYDADKSVFFDLASKLYDKSDAKYAFLVLSMTTEEYEDKYDDSPDSWDNSVSDTEFDWSTDDGVYIAEYYEVKDYEEKVYTFIGLTGEEDRYFEHDFEDNPDLEDDLNAQGLYYVSDRTVKRKRVHKYILSGGSVLEDCGYIAGSCIPLVPYYGNREFIDGVEVVSGEVRWLKDISRLKNMGYGILGEIAAKGSYRKPIFYPEQVLGHEQKWADDDVDNYPFLTINPLTDAAGNKIPQGPVGYKEPPAIPQSVQNLMAQVDQDIKDLVGNKAEGEKIRSNLSGDAVDLIQQKIDMHAYLYFSNLAKTQKRLGEVWLSMASDVYVEEGRELLVTDEENKMATVEIAKPYYDSETGKTKYKNDFKNAKFKVIVDVGPASSSKRHAAVRKFVQMMPMVKSQQTAEVLEALAMMNMDGEGVNETRGYWRMKLIKMGVIKPTQEEAESIQKELANTPKDAQTQYLEAASEEALAKAQKSKADTMLQVAKTEETKAKTAETLAEIDEKEREGVIKTVKAIDEMQNRQTQNIAS